MATLSKPDPQAAKKYFQDKIAYTTGPVELNHWLEDKPAVNVVDVRRAEDYATAHIPGAVSLPREKWSSFEGLNKDRTNVLYCYSQTCHLAPEAAVLFAGQGYPVMEMEGGFRAWQENHLDIETGVKEEAVVSAMKK